MTEILHARREHGFYPVRCRSGVYEILKSENGPVIGSYENPRQLITALTRNPRHRHTLESYFGKPDPILALLPDGLSIWDLVPSPVTRLVARDTKVGIDLAVRGKEVRKLLFAGFGSRIIRSGYDPEDVLQEVYRGLLARNNGKCPFDARKSSFGHYVHMVCECILNNYHRKESRKREFEQIGVSAPAALQDDAGSSGQVDAAEMAESAVGHEAQHQGMGDALERMRFFLLDYDIDPDVGVRIAQLLSEGHTRREIATEMKISMNELGKLIEELQDALKNWT